MQLWDQNPARFLPGVGVSFPSLRGSLSPSEGSDARSPPERGNACLMDSDPAVLPALRTEPQGTRASPQCQPWDCCVLGT